MRAVSEQEQQNREGKDGPPGIVIAGGRRAPEGPRIAAFIWGGKVRPVPTLPFGRWKVAPT